MDFAGKIIEWYLENKRNLPWRNTNDPFKIWLSEVILQQTRVEQGISCYYKFTERFQNIYELANANEQEVLKLWQGLGYYSRARNLHFAAKTIINELGGKIPTTFEGLKKLKGIGDYTASAIASIAFNQPHPVVDGNVARVISRVFGITIPVDSIQGKKEITELSQQLISKNDPGTYNQAVMEFGALYCKPQNPNCENCIFREQCFAFQNKKVETLPVKTKKIKTRNRYFYYLEITLPENKIIIEKRTGNDIWKNLYQFPLIETDKEVEIETLIQHSQWKELIGNNTYQVKKISERVIHILSHQKIYTRFISVEMDDSLNDSSKPNYIVIRRYELDKYPFPRLIERYLERSLSK